MNKNQTSQPPEDLEKELRDFHASPEPRPEFISRLERDLHSKLEAQEKTKMFGNPSKRKWALGFALAAALIGLLIASPTIVTAMKRLLGYIPGVGLVDTASPFRVLAEPVSLTRDGITVTVEQALLSSDKTALVYTTENIPFDELSHAEGNPGCMGGAEVRLPDGRILQQMSGSGTGWGTGMEMRFTYAPIPADVNEAVFFLPCIQDALPGALPEDWELPLRFIPAPPEMTLVPVIEVMPEETSAAVESPLILEKVIETETGYILIGRFDSTPLEADANVLGISEWPAITDANGQQVEFTTPNDLDITTSEMGVFPWAYQLNSKQFAFPLTITLAAVDAETASSEARFEFDTGANPQSGQEWTLNQELQFDAFSVTLNSIRFNGDGYAFKFTSESQVNPNISVEINGFTPAGGGGGGDNMGSIESSIVYEGNPPVGKLSFIFHSTPIVKIRGPWRLEWQPENATLLPPPVPTESPTACLTLDSWQAALANPQPIPADLTGTLSMYGRIIDDGQEPSPDNYGVYVVNLDGSGKQIVGQGVGPSLSPDGARLVYAWGDGLYLADLASGESHLIPNTLSSDYGPRWSPDGKQIAFMRIDDFNLYVINPDGTDLKKVIDGIDYELLVGWSPDGTSLFYGKDTQDGILLNRLDIASGSTHELFAVASKGLEVSLSPDGTRLAFLSQAGSATSLGIYTAALDGSDRRLVAQLGHWLALRPVWSPDGNWLVMGVLNTDESNAETQITAVNLQSCQIVPLSLGGDVSSWVQ